MKAKHTQGPWTLKEADATIPVVGADGKTVASIRYRERDYSDACLIAAAPEMLEALRDVEFQFGLLYEAGMLGTEDAETLAAVRAAIAKAEGR